MRVVGLSAFYHDSAAALVDGGRIVAAAQEERFSRIKHDSRFPAAALGFCLDAGGIALDEVDRIVFFEKPFLKFERLLETYLAFAPRGLKSFSMALPLWLQEKLFQRRTLTRTLRDMGGGGDIGSRLRFVQHHVSHAASAFFPSPFDRAAILTMDGVGEWATASIGRGEDNRVEILKELRWPHSLGLLYSAFTYYCGFRVNSGEYKLMGLAPYGEPRFAQTILDNLVDLKEDGSFRLDLAYFDYCTGLTMTGPRFDDLFGGAPRPADGPIDQRHMDLAASIQSVTETIVLRLAETAKRATGADRLCLAGGVALNCVANGRLHRSGLFRDIWVQPASGDAGGALGAALACAHAEGAPREAAGRDTMQGAFLGPEFSDAEIEAALIEAGATFERVTGDAALIDVVANDLADGRVVGWFQGRMEFGPRSLGNRSILADPGRPDMQATLNARVKRREGFRPFAPSVALGEAADWFDHDRPSPYMQFTAPVRADRRADLPAVTHVDGSARLQTVDPATHPLFHAVIAAFGARTGRPVVVNTSFNLRGEPVVCSPADAIRCFLATDIDSLGIGRFFLRKVQQSRAAIDRAIAGLPDFAPD